MSKAIPEILSLQHNFFNTKKTQDIPFIKQCLTKLKVELINHNDAIIEALYKDFKKPPFESVMTETEIVLAELSHTIRNLKKWRKTKRILPSLLNFPSSDYLYKEPYGTVLCIAPWNYPYQLALAPLIGAIAAGNTVVLKPSELTPHTSKVIASIISKVFEPNHAAVVEGGIPVATELLQQRWDYIFFTGSVPVGKIVAKAAAAHLTPVTLELGGKSPCIIDETANIKLSAKRIVWGKFMNAGQTCIAPDYILIHQTVKQAFYDAMKVEITNAFGSTPKDSSDFARIVNTRNFERLSKMLENQSIAVGGQTDVSDNYIAPTLIDEPNLKSEVMRDEIFGPILPVISYQSEGEIAKVIANFEKPLSFYVFSNSRKFAKNLIKNYAFGGGVINDTVIHFTNHRLPFGGVGHSGMGAYHGRRSIDTFLHEKPVIIKGNWLDIPIRYAPYKGKLKLIKFFLKNF